MIAKGKKCQVMIGRPATAQLAAVVVFSHDYMLLSVIMVLLLYRPAFR
jgi:hypothetical protein